MTGYKVTAGDVEAPQERLEVLVEKKSSSGWMWKGLGVLLLLALGIGGARLYVWYRLERSESATAAPVMMGPQDTEAAHSTLKEMSRKAKAAIHLVGHYDEDDQKAELEWRDAVDQAFSQGGLRLRNNRIVIPEGGLYFVYSQASFRASCGEDRAGEAASTPLVHRILRMSEAVGAKVSLMSAVRSACQAAQGEDGGRGCYSTIYLGAVFQLNGGDELWTETKQLSQLETGQGKTFFGVFAL